MKRIITTLVVALFTTGFTFAGGGWATCAVNITKDGGSVYSFPINTAEGWTDGDWMVNTEFDGFNFGTPTSLILNGAYGNAWTDDSPGYNSTSFVLYYRVYKTGSTPGTWSQIALDNKSYNSGNNYIYDKTNAAIDILALATASGTNTYTLEVAMSKNQFYVGGNWNSMIPGGQATAYNSTNAGYTATFTKTNTTTGLNQINEKVIICSQNRQITAKFSGKAQIVLYSVTGQLLDKTTAYNNFIQTVKQGIYLLQINNTTHKVIVD